MFGIDFTEALNWAIPVGFLLLIDFLLGAIAAALAGSFKTSWLYVFARTKGVAFVMGIALLVVGAIAPGFDQLGDSVPAGIFTGFGLSFLGPLAISLVASITGNIVALRDGGDVTAPTGVDIKLPVTELIDEPVTEE